MLEHFTSGINNWELRYKLDLLAAKVRGRWFLGRGYVESVGAKGQPLIGPTHRSFFEKKAKIVLQAASNGTPPKNTPEDFNRHAYSLGLLNPRRYQNPPSRPSRFRMSEESRLVLFEHSRIGPGFYFSIGHKATVSIGSWTYIGSDFDIHCRSTVQIGSRCMISHGVRMIDYDGHRISYAGKENSDIFVSGFNVGGCAPITIEDEVWIGMGVTILKGVRIARGAVVSAGSTVCSDVPTGCLVAGNPARVVKEEVSWSHF